MPVPDCTTACRATVASWATCGDTTWWPGVCADVDGGARPVHDVVDERRGVVHAVVGHGGVGRGHLDGVHGDGPDDDRGELGQRLA